MRYIFDVYISEKENGYASLRAFNGKFLMVNIADNDYLPLKSLCGREDINIF